MNISTRRAIRIHLLTITVAAISATSVAMRDNHSPPESTSPRAESTSATQASQPGNSTAVQPPTMADEKPIDLPGLHNVVAFHDGFYSGSVPHGDEAFDALAAIGVKTIISVDGAVPEVEAAKARGIRYIHLPIGYNGFDDQRRLELVRATRDAMVEGRVYLHCHHGKHRSAGAAGTVAASLGWLTPEQAVDRMRISGTAPNYKGLFACTANATALDAKTIDAVPADFPEISQPATFVRSMVEIDELNDHLKVIEKAGWSTPADHPDLVPAAEAGRMADLFRLAADGERAKSKPEDFAAMLLEDSRRISQIEEMLAAMTNRPDAKANERSPRPTPAETARLSELFKAVQTSCKDCHAKFRD